MDAMHKPPKKYIDARVRIMVYLVKVKEVGRSNFMMAVGVCFVVYAVY